MLVRRHPRLLVFAFAVALVASQAFSGRAAGGGSACGSSPCLTPPTVGAVGVAEADAASLAGAGAS